MLRPVLPSKHRKKPKHKEFRGGGLRGPKIIDAEILRVSYLGPDVMQSGFGVNFLFWSGELWENGRRISQWILMANFDSEFFGLVFFPGFQATPKNSRPKFTSRIVGIPLQFHFLEPKIYSRRFSAYGGDQLICALITRIGVLHLAKDPS